ncbi:MAG: ice-binding family protein [Myxococcota bacterium]|nr:ice-binding family protein [Myxococcota bacterium]
MCLLASLASCGDNLGAPAGIDSGDRRDAAVDVASDVPMATVPTVTGTTPSPSATNVARNGNVSVTFSEPMTASTLNGTTFTVTTGTPAVAVSGTVVPSASGATFWPSAQLPADTTFTATVTTGAKSAANVPLAMAHSWTFMTGTTIGPTLGVNLGTAGGFVILSKSGIMNVPTSAVTGDIGVSPIAATAIVGFDLTADATNVFSTSLQVTGRVYAANYAAPTPSNLTTAVSNMQTAYTDAAARAPDVTNLGAGQIGTITLNPGVYKWGTGLLIPTDITLSGSATDVWIFQIAGDLTISNGVNITLAGNALAKNVYWQVAGQVSAGTTAHLEGIVLSMTSITLDTGASINGRLYAQTAVVIRGATVVQPAP